MDNKITFRAIIEVLGKPKEHVEKSLREYVEKIKQDEKYHLTFEDVAESQKLPDQELWSIFAEVEVDTKQMVHVTSFCFDYMPSLIEIIEPESISLKDVEFTHFLNDLQAKLHQVDMVSKQVKLENDIWKKSVHDLLGNCILLLLRENNLDSKQLSVLTGVVQNKLEDFLDQLIDEGKIDLKEGIYYLKAQPEE